YKQPADATAAVSNAYTQVNIGCGVGGFNWKKDSNALPYAWTSFIYWPVLFQHKTAKTASHTVAFLVPHNARNWTGDSSTAGERSFKKEIMPPIILTAAAAILGIAETNVNYEWLRIPIHSRAIEIEGSLYQQNQDIVTSSFGSYTEDDRVITLLYTVMGDKTKPETIISGCGFPDIGRTTTPDTVSGNIIASYLQDNVIDLIEFAVDAGADILKRTAGLADRNTKIIKISTILSTSSIVNCYFYDFLGLNSFHGTKESITKDIIHEGGNFGLPHKIMYKICCQTEMNGRTSETNFADPMKPTTISDAPDAIFKFI
ncbi:MAG: hypothetical protein KAH32_09255, partial [Chlamydiia bacterium]|nr:hypothetical protein [Chlamydiia bacterium]